MVLRHGFPVRIQNGGAIMTTCSLPFWTDVLQLPDYEVVGCQLEADLRRYRLTLTPKHRVGFCPYCETLSDTVHATRTRERIQDLSISQTPSNFRCACCSSNARR